MRESQSETRAHTETGPPLSLGRSHPKSIVDSSRRLRVVTSVKTVNKRHGPKRSEPKIGNDLKEINAETYQNETVGVSMSEIHISR